MLRARRAVPEQLLAFAIAGVNVAHTHFANTVVRDNRSKGIHFTGDTHSIIDSEVSGSP